VVARRDLSRDLWIYVLLFASVLIVYSPVRTHDFIDYDDPVYVTENPHVRDGLTLDGAGWAITSLEYSNWFPLTWLSHMLDVEMFGLDAGAHHMMSVFLHAISTLALFALLVRVTGARWPSAFAAFAFGLHPLHVESVAWAAERKDVLSALFWLLNLLAYAWYVEKPSKNRYFTVLGLFVCGSMSKAMVVTLPFLMLLLDFWPLRRKITRQLVMEKVPLFAISIVASVVTFIAQKQSGAVAALEKIPFTLRAANALLTYVVYVVKFLWPSRLAVFYPYPDSIHVWQWLFALAAIAAVTWIVVRLRDSRPYLFTGWFWYLGTLVPVIGLVQVGSQARADRYTYLPMIGISIMLFWLIADTVKSTRSLNIAAAVICCVWSAVTWTYLGDWKNTVTLFRHTIAVTDKNWVACNNLAGTLRRAGQLNEAIQYFEAAAKYRPDVAYIHDNLGEALIKVGRVDDAISQLHEALRLDPSTPKAHVDLGTALLRQGRTQEAAAEFQEELRYNPNSAEAHFRLGGLLMSEGRAKDAMPHFQTALPYLIETARVNPNDVEAHHNLGGVYGLMGRMDEAIVEFTQVVRLQPNDPEGQYNLGLALADRGRLNEAVIGFSNATHLKPDYVMAHYNLARTLAALGRNVEAEQEFSQTLRLAPDFEGARKGLASLRP